MKRKFKKKFLFLQLAFYKLIHNMVMKLNRFFIRKAAKMRIKDKIIRKKLLEIIREEQNERYKND